MLQQAHQTNLGDVGLDDLAHGRLVHNEFLTHCLANKQTFFLEPDAKINTGQGTLGGNPSSYPLVVTPILDDQGGVFGLFEVWLDADSDAKLRALHVQFINHMAGFATTSAQQHGLAEFRSGTDFHPGRGVQPAIHASLNPTEVAFLVVNEGRRLIGCDRLAAGIRYGRLRHRGRQRFRHRRA